MTKVNGCGTEVSVSGRFQAGSFRPVFRQNSRPFSGRIPARLQTGFPPGFRQDSRPVSDRIPTRFQLLFFSRFQTVDLPRALIPIT